MTCWTASFKPSSKVFGAELVRPVLALLAGLWAATPALAVDVPPRGGPQRGMVVSCPQDGRVWGTTAMDEALTELKGLGVEWVQLHPWGRIARDGTVSFRPTSSTPFLETGAAKVVAAGYQLAWAPHLAWWGSFEWRGAIDFGDDEVAWSRFFGSYSDFIVAQAELAERVGAGMLVVGLELEGTTARELQWRELIAKVRKRYSGELVYAANWDRLDRVPFWDAVDLIGVQAYFPLGTEDSTEAQLSARWRSLAADLAGLSQRFSKPVLFNEIGYPRGRGAAQEPWTPVHSNEAAAISLRERLLRVTLAELETLPFLRGLFWWKWVAGDDRYDRDFSMREPEAVRVLRELWGAPTAARRRSHTAATLGGADAEGRRPAIRYDPRAVGE